jgi:hypothetical protein
MADLPASRAVLVHPKKQGAKEKAFVTASTFMLPEKKRRRRKRGFP